MCLRQNNSPYHLCLNKGPLSGSSPTDAYTRLLPTYSYGIFGPPLTTDSPYAAEGLRRTLILEEDEFFTQLCIGLLLIGYGKRTNLACTSHRFANGWFRLRRQDLRAACRMRKGMMVWVDQTKNVGVEIAVLAEVTEEGTGTVGFEVEVTWVLVRSLWVARELDSGHGRLGLPASKLN
jgi:hypothetical protein